MKKKLIKLTVIQKYFQKLENEKKERRRKAFMKDLTEVKERLSSVQSRFDLISDSDLVDSLIYEEKSLLSRYEYLIKTAKLTGLTSDIVLNA